MASLSAWLDRVLHANGFTRIGGGDYFVRSLAGGRQAIGMAVWDYNPRVEIALTVSVRLEAVERVFHLFSGADPDYHNLSSTIVTPFHYFARGPSRVTAERIEDLHAVFDAWEVVLHAEVLPYLDRATDVGSLDTLVNVTNDVLDIANPPYSFMHHLIIAKLAANPAYDHLIANHRSELRDMGYETDLYDKLVDYLGVSSH